MKLWFVLGALLALLVTYPALAAALLGAVGTLAVTAATKPPVLAFLAGLAVGPRLARRWAR